MNGDCEDNEGTAKGQISTIKTKKRIVSIKEGAGIEQDENGKYG
jgi:hypothetical protein